MQPRQVERILKPQRRVQDRRSTLLRHEVCGKLIDPQPSTGQDRMGRIHWAVPGVSLAVQTNEASMATGAQTRGSVIIIVTR